MPIPNEPTYDHGSTGTKPVDPIDYQNGDSLDAENLDYYLNTQFTTLDQIIRALREIRDGVITVTDAQTAVDADNVTGTYKGNDIDSDGDGKVDAADTAADATTVAGNTVSDIRPAVTDSGTQITNAVQQLTLTDDITATHNGSGEVTITTQTTPNTQTAVDNNGTRLQNNTQEINFTTNITATDDGNGSVTVSASGDATTYKNNDIDSDADGRVDAADDTTTVKGNDIDSDGDGTVDAAETAAALNGTPAAQINSRSVFRDSAIGIDGAQRRVRERYTVPTDLTPNSIPTTIRLTGSNSANVPNPAVGLRVTAKLDNGESYFYELDDVPTNGTNTRRITDAHQRQILAGAEIDPNATLDELEVSAITNTGESMEIEWDIVTKQLR